MVKSVLYVLLFLILWWSYQGYFIYLYLFKYKRKNNSQDLELENQPEISIIVPTFNEENIVASKIENIKAFLYKKYQVYLVDASSDKTAAIIEDNISELANFRLIKSEIRGRSAQINKALSLIQKGIVIVTDADALMQENSLEEILMSFQDNIGFVGGCVFPETSYKLNSLFWRSQNMMRFAESLYGHSPVASGACYAFRREVLDLLPQDVWADDIYIPFLANLGGFNCLYASNISVKEVRAPIGFRNFLKGKIRKAQDNIKEILRFLPRIFKMNFKWRVVYLTRLIQILILPLIVWPGLFLFFFQERFLVILSAGVVSISGLIQLGIFKKLSKDKQKFSIFNLIKVFFVTNFILLFALLKYFFSKGEVKYSKVGSV